MSQTGTLDRIRPAWRQLRSPGGRVRRAGEVAVETVKSLFANNAAEWAAAMAYYSLLSVFPLLLVAVSLAAFVVDPQWATDRATAILGGYLPEGEEQVTRIVEGAVAERGRLGLISGLALLWTAGRVLATLTLALNAVCDDDDPDDAPRRFLVSVALLFALGFAFALALLSDVLVRAVWDLLGAVPDQRGPILAALQGGARALTLLGAFFLVYRLVPRAQPGRRAALVGAVAATLLFLAAQPLFLLAVDRSESYRVTYGPLALAAILMVWAWVVAFVTLVGGQLAFSTQAVLFDGRPAAASRPRSRRSATDRQAKRGARS